MVRVPTIILADAARSHGDGTVGLLRAGIDRLYGVADTPTLLRAALVARAKSESDEDQGTHTFLTRIRELDGPFSETLGKGEFVIVSVGGASLISDFILPLPRFGRYVIEVLIDDEVRAEWPLSVDVRPVP